jgi:hypothetical protein
MTTVYDHLRLNAGLISAMPGRSTIMSTKITVEFTGNMQGLVEFLETTYSLESLLDQSLVRRLASLGLEIDRDVESPGAGFPPTLCLTSSGSCRTSSR